MGKLRLKVSLAVPRCRLVFGFERLEVDEDALTKDLFDQFHHKTGFPQETLCAVYFGKDMKPELPLSSYEMLDNSEVHIMPLKYDDFKVRVWAMDAGGPSSTDSMLHHSGMASLRSTPSCGTWNGNRNSDESIRFTSGFTPWLWTSRKRQAYQWQVVLRWRELGLTPLLRTLLDGGPTRRKEGVFPLCSFMCESVRG